MLEKIERYVNDNHLFDRSDKLIVGVSGGADSMALLDALTSLNYNCIVAHCNFHLRTDESDRDEEFVKNICSRSGFVYESIDFDTIAYARAKSISIEMAARELRYTWFEELRNRHEASYIVIAHHSDDSIETVLLNLIRGTGIRGLRGISPKNGFVVRPLLCVDRAEIENYLVQKHIEFVTDSTNNEDIYTRNKIRLHLIPLLETINPSAKRSIKHTAEHLCQVEQIYSDYVGVAIHDLLVDNKIDIEGLLKCTQPKAILFEILHGYGFNSDTVSDIYNALSGTSGKQFYADKFRLVKDRQYLVIEPIKRAKEDKVYYLSEDDFAMEYPLKLSIERLEDARNIVFEKSNNLLYADRAKLKFPLFLRKWNRGDWFIPFGMKGRKKLSDFFSDQKFSLVDKENVWLLCSGNDIVWIVGHRTDDRYKVSSDTKDVLKIVLSESN